MFLEQRTVSRKTPGDGKLEISPATAERLAALGEGFPIASAERLGRGSVESMTCTCAKGAGDRHVHHFVESELFKELNPGGEVRLELDEARGVVRVEGV